VIDGLHAAGAGRAAPRARGLGIPFSGEPGRWNAITDVPGVEVGHRTLIRGTGVRTGVTVVHPRGRATPGVACAAGYHSLNGNGEMTGVAWVEESGTVALPITLTSTHAVGIAHEATVRWVVEGHPELADRWHLPVAAETWDGYLNEANGGHVTAADVTAAIESAASGAVPEGAVGGGTGMCCYGFKGGVGSASRVVRIGRRTHTVGALLQCNFGARRELVIAGLAVGAELAADDPLAAVDRLAAGGGSVIALIATDAPLLPGQCRAIARRVPLGLARTGTTGSHYSGDLFLAFSTANRGAFESDPGTLEFVPWGSVDPLYEAVVQAVEEAVLNALVAGEEMAGRDGRRVPGLPRDRVAELFLPAR